MERKDANNNMTFLKMMDIFESPVTLSYNNRYLYQTNFGGILTIITVLTIFVYSITSLIELFQGSNYSLVSNELIDYKYKLDFSNVPFGFKLINSKGEDFPLDPSIYNYKIINTEYYFNYIENEKVINYIEEEIEFDFCEKFIGKKEFYSISDISNLICIKPGQNLTMYGKFGDSNGFKGFRIYINRCNTKIENNTCLDKQTINKKLSNIKFIFFYLGYEINHYSNNKNIVQSKLLNGENGLSINFMKKFYYKFQKVNYKLDNYLLFNHKDNFNFFISDGYEYDFELDSSNSLASSDDSLGYFAFNTNAKIVEYTKVLENLWDVCSQIGGVFNIVVSISKIINSFVSRRILLLDVNENLINEYFPVINKIEMNKDIKTIFKNIDNERIRKKEFLRNENSSIEINNKNEKLFESKIRHGCMDESHKYFSQVNSANIANLSRKSNSRFKIFKAIKDANKQSIFWYYICPFFFLKKISKLKYFAQLEQDFNDCFSIENFLKVLKINKIKIKIEKNADIHIRKT